MKYEPLSLSFLPLWSCILYDLQDGDMIVRNAANTVVLAFVDSVQAMIAQNELSDEEVQKYQTGLINTLLSVIRFIIKSTHNDNVRRSIISLLRHMVLVWDPMSLPLWARDLSVFVSKDEEKDVLLQLIDVKVKGRVNGLRSIVRIVNQVQEHTLPAFSTTTLRTVFVPIIFSYIQEYSAKSGESLQGC